jgi:hypothetical protein
MYTLHVRMYVGLARNVYAHRIWPYVCVVISLLNILYIHRIYVYICMVLANPTCMYGVGLTFQVWDVWLFIRQPLTIWTTHSPSMSTLLFVWTWVEQHHARAVYLWFGHWTLDCLICNEMLLSLAENARCGLCSYVDAMCYFTATHCVAVMGCAHLLMRCVISPPPTVWL